MTEPEAFALPVSYVGFDDTPIVFANAFLCQFQEGEFTITFAQLAPPVVPPGEEEQMRAQLLDVGFVPARVLGRYGLTRKRLVELIGALQENLATHDATQERRARREGDTK